nr:FHA domain-containing protein [Anaerolineae bacterium]
MPAIPAVLVVTKGILAGSRITLSSCPCSIGRAEECDLTLADAGISRLHARIDRSFGRYSIIDLSSTNGTFVNGLRIDAPTPLQDGDEIRLGSAATMLFEDPASTDQIDLAELSISGIQIDQKRKEVFANGQMIDPPLSPSQYALVSLLVANMGEIVTREKIARIVWPGERYISDQMIDTLVSRLRKRLAEYGVDEHIITRRGFGLMLASQSPDTQA